MSIISELLMPKMQAATQRDKTGWFVDWAQGGDRTLSGERMGNDKALQLAAVFACINNISQDVAKIPLIVYKRLTEGKERRPKHRLYNLLHNQPNPEMTAITFRQTLTSHLLGWGNAFAEIERDIEGEVFNLWPLRPDRVRVFRLEDNRIWYEIRNDEGQNYWLPAENCFHIPALGFDGLVGYNVVRYARESFALAAAAQKFGAAFFGNACTTSGTLEHPAKLTEEAQKRLIRSIESRHQSADKALRLMVLEEGMKFNKTTIPPEEAQFLETRQFGVVEICRWFRMPPHKIQDLQRATFSNIEHQALEYVGDTLLPWLVRWEQAIWTKLFSNSEKTDGYFAEHLIEGLLRGDIASRYSAYAIARQWGWINADEIRERENMNPLPEKEGKKYLVPLNMRHTDEPLPVERAEPPRKEKEDFYEGLILDAADRIASAEIREIAKVIGKSTENREKFNGWVEKFYKNHAKYVEKTLLAFEKLCGLNSKAATEQLISEAIEAFTQDDPLKVFAAWQYERKEKIAILIREGIKNAYTQTT